MSYILNDKLIRLKPYDPIEGYYEVRLDANESFIPLDNVIKDRINSEIIKMQLNRYPDPYAQGAVNAFSELYGIDNKYVTAGNGSDELISIITSCFLKSGDNIVTMSPDFSMYVFYGSLYELNTYIYEKEKDFTVDVERLISFCKKNKAKMLMFSNPCNPTSLGMTREDVKMLLDNLDCLIVLDEAYMDFWDQSLLGEIDKYDNLIILKTCSKAIGLAGIRFGFAVAGETITTALKAAKSPYNTDLISQKIIEIVLSYNTKIHSNINLILQNKRALELSLKALNNKYRCFDKIYDSKTNFVYVKTKAADFIYKSLLDESVAIRKFDNHLRISAGSIAENSRLITALDMMLWNRKE